MITKEQIKVYYSHAREFVKNNKPDEARTYVLQILNVAGLSYKKAPTLLEKAKLTAFIKRWVDVSRDLFDFGITPFVLECFNLNDSTLPTPESPKAETPPKTQGGANEKPRGRGNDIDISGILGDDNAVQNPGERVDSKQGDGAEIFKTNINAVVEVHVTDGFHGSCGTGFIISKNGYLLTNDHVVYDEDNDDYFPDVKMNFHGKKKKFKLEILMTDKNSDIALCKFNPSSIETFDVVKKISDFSTVEDGADCIIVGNSFGKGLSPISGIVRFRKDDGGDLVHTAPSNPGDSGAPVFLKTGECIGINKSRTVSINGVTPYGYANATPMDKIDELLKKWAKSLNIKL